MKIDIDKLTKAELIDLNNRSVERLRFLACRSLSAQTGLLMISVRAATKAAIDRAGLRGAIVAPPQ